MAKILIVDDDYAYSEYAKMLVESAGHEVTICQDGDSAVARIQSDKPDLIITDIGLPDFSGIEVIRRIREKPDSENTPVLICSMSHEPPKPDEVKGVGEADFFRKPVDKERFLERIASRLSGG